VAALACRPDLAEDGRWPPVPSSAELPISPASSSATKDRASRCWRAARGPAPSGVWERISVRPSGLLRAIRSHAAVTASAILFVLVPPGFTAS